MEKEGEEKGSDVDLEEGLIELVHGAAARRQDVVLQKQKAWGI